MPNYNVEFYEKPSGEVPVRDFILGLNPKMQAKIFQEIDSLEFFGPLAREPISKPIGDGIFELRAQFSNNITRIFYFFYVGKTVTYSPEFRGFLSHGNQGLCDQQDLPQNVVLQSLLQRLMSQPYGYRFMRSTEKVLRPGC